MKRRLIVMRHAKSSWNSAGGPDHERPLNDRGRRDAPRVGAALVEGGWIPDLVLSSDSQRTRETFAGLSESFPSKVEARFLPSFYSDGFGAVQGELPRVSDEITCLLVLGHNPGWESLVEWLSGEDIVMKPATAALLGIDLDPEGWGGAIQPGLWKLENVISPREI